MWKSPGYQALGVYVPTRYEKEGKIQKEAEKQKAKS